MDTVNSKQQVAAMEETEQLSERWQNELPGSFMNSGAYIFFDQYRTVFFCLWQFSHERLILGGR